MYFLGVHIPVMVIEKKKSDIIFASCDDLSLGQVNITIGFKVKFQNNFFLGFH